MMKSIVICEDDPMQLNQIETYISNYIMIEELPLKVELATPNPQEVLDYLEKTNYQQTLYFLDIDFNYEFDGLDLAKMIRKKDDLSKIVFITTHDELLPLTYTYQIEALGYIVKDSGDNIQEQIIQTINTVLARMPLNSKEKEVFVINQRTRSRTIDVSNILYFMTSPTPHKVILITKDSMIDFYDNLYEIEDRFDCFLRINRSYIINVDNVESVDYTERLVYFSNGDEVPASREGLRQLSKVLSKE